MVSTRPTAMREMDALSVGNVLQDIIYTKKAHNHEEG